MEDTHIVQMYWDRTETAISESAMKYGTYCTSIAQNILQNPADAEECVNDTWLHAWNGTLCRRTGRLCYPHFLEK